MKLSFYIGKRYFLAKKSRLINWISGISTISIAVGTAALIIVMSVFNGLSSLVSDLYSSFDPDLKIEAVSGKYFNDEAVDMQALKSINGVDACVPVLEENILLKYGDKQQIATIKGIRETLRKKVEPTLVKGDFLLKEQLGESLIPYTIVGYGLYLNLGITLESPQMVGLYAPKRGTNLNIASPDAFSSIYAVPAGIFSSILEYDNKYVLADLSLVKTLIGAEDEISAIEILVDETADLNNVQKQVQQIAGEGFVVKTQKQQHEMYFKTVQSERFVTVLILSFILLIATFNMIASLMMIIYDKRKDIETLNSMGADFPLIRNIFLFQGLMMGFIGGFIGLCFGGLVVWLQEQFGLVKLGDGFVVNAYPVELQFNNFILVFGIVLLIAFLSAIVPILKIKKKN